MRYVHLATVALLGLSCVPVLAQSTAGLDPMTGARAGHEVGIGDSLPRSDKASNIGLSDTRSAIAPTLPPSTMGENAAAHDYLRAARASLVAGRTGQAQQALEMAETRVLDRSVPQGDASIPSDSRLVSRIRDARHALGGGDRAQAIAFIDLALAG